MKRKILAAALAAVPCIGFAADDAKILEDVYKRQRYESVAQVMSLAAKAGLVRIGFVSEPTAE